MKTLLITLVLLLTAPVWLWSQSVPHGNVDVRYGYSLNVKEFGAVGNGLTNDSTAIQTALDAVSSTFGGIVYFPPGEYLITTGLTISKSYTAMVGAGWGSAVLKANGAITMLKITGAAHVVIDGIKFDGNSKTATNCLSFLPTVGGTNQYSSIRNIRVTQCQTGILVGATNNFSVVGLSFIGFQVFSNNTGIQQQGINTGDIFYGDGAITDNLTVGFDMGTSQQAVFRGVSTNGLNGAADFRAGDTGNLLLSIEDAITNPSQGPYLLVNGVTGQQMILSVILKNNHLSWNGTAGGDMISYKGQGTVTIENGYLQGDGVIRVSPTQALSNSGPSLIDFNVGLRGSPEPTFVVTGGRRFSIPAVSVNAGTNRAIGLTNYALAQSRSTPTYGASVAIDARLGNFFDVTANNGTAFTVSNPTNATDGQRLTITVRNTSVGALGTVTWDTLYKMSAWVSPLTANSRSIEFKYNGAAWIEISRTPNDVPN